MNRDRAAADDLFTKRLALGLRELDGREQAPDVSARVTNRLATEAPGAGRTRLHRWPLLAALLALAVTAVLWTQRRGGSPSAGAAPAARQDPKAGEAGGHAAAGATSRRPTDVDLGHGYVRRDGAIHFLGGGTTGAGEHATRIDTPSPAVVRGFARAESAPPRTCEGLDVASFVVLSEAYARDQGRVYQMLIANTVFLVVPLPEADPASFEVVAGDLTRDAQHVFYGGRIQRGVDPATLELVDAGWAFKDRDFVQYQHERIAGADPASFRHLGSGYYADRHRVYWCSQPVPDAEPTTFEVLGGSFVAKDRTRVYRSGQYLPRYDAASLQLILHDPMGFQVLLDKHGIHVNTKTFPRAKPGRVEVLDNLTAKTGDLVLLVETSRFNPVTVFRQGGKLMAATPAYEATSGAQLGTITAEVTPEGLVNIRTEPLPGSGRAPAVPRWQVDVLGNPELVQRMILVGRLLE